MGNDRTFTDEQIKAGREAFYGTTTPIGSGIVTDEGLVERIARTLANDLTARLLAEAEDADTYDDMEPHMQDYWEAIAQAAIEATGILALTRTLADERKESAFQRDCVRQESELHSATLEKLIAAEAKIASLSQRPTDGEG